MIPDSRTTREQRKATPPGEDLESLAREAVACRICFESFSVQAPTIDLAQPRWVGPRYWTASRRMLLLLLNPGSGEGYNEAPDRQLRELLTGFRDGRTPLQEVFAHQARDMSRWGKGRFVSFYLSGLGLTLDEIAFANVAWCATRGNQYPSRMLRTCFERFTRRLLDVLSPDVVLLSGSKVHAYHRAIQQQLPEGRVLPILHYAHRGGAHVEEAEFRRIAHELGEEAGRSD